MFLFVQVHGKPQSCNSCHSQSHVTLMMTSAQVVEASVSVTNNSPSRDYSHQDDQTTPFVALLGPSADHNGNAARYYLFMEVSGRLGGEKAKILVDPRFRGLY